ncbi:unnamed protein product [Cercospora beticola]|nr:unnamed protein product [Cercospora beticola]
MWWKRSEEAAPPAAALQTPPPPPPSPPIDALPVLPIPHSMPEPQSQLEQPRTPIQLRNDAERLSLPLYSRLPLSITIASVTGLLLGLAKGSQDTNFRFRAENAHRLPTTQQGWFLYHKSKNYNMMLGGIKEGTRQSLKFGAWTGLFFLLEEGVDRGRAAGRRMWGRFWGGEWKSGAREMRLASAALSLDDEEHEEEEIVRDSRDCFSSMLAGLGIAGMFSAWNRFPVPTAARTAKMGAKAGLAFGVLQDMVSLLKGRRVGYVEFVKRLAGDGHDEELPG